MKKELDAFAQVRQEIREIDRKIQCLSACFMVISQPEMLDSVNYQLLALKVRRNGLMNQLKGLYQEQIILGK